MKSARISFDFNDNPKIVEILRDYSASSGKSQKSILKDALESYFAEKLETRMLHKAAENTFADWDNDNNEIYNGL